MDADYVIQSVVFKQPKFTPAEAKKWLKEHHYSGRSLDRTANMLRFRQMTPKKVERYGFTEYRTKELGRSGISLVIAYKKSIEGGSLSSRFRNVWNRIRGRHRIAIDAIPPQPDEQAPEQVMEQQEQAPDPDPPPQPDAIEQYFGPRADLRERELRRQYIQFQEQLQDDIDEFESLQRMGGWGDSRRANNLLSLGRDRIFSSQNQLRGAEERLNNHMSAVAYLYLANRPVGNSEAVRQAQERFDRIREERFGREFDIRFPPPVIPPEDMETEREIYEPDRGYRLRTPREPYMEDPPPIPSPPEGYEEYLPMGNDDDETQVEEYITPRGNGVYMKGFGRMIGGRIKRKTVSAIGEEEVIDPDLEDAQEEEQTEAEIAEIEEYNTYVEMLSAEMDEMDGYLIADEIDVDNGKIDDEDDELRDLIEYKRQELGRILVELGGILDATQDIEIAKLVKQYMDEYIEIDQPFVEPAEWYGGILLE